MSRYRFVSTMKAEGFAVRAACEAAEVSTSAYYAWLATSSGPTDTEWAEAKLVNEIVDIHRDSAATYGSPRVTAALRRRGFCVNHKHTERLMAVHGIVGLTMRKKGPRTTLQAEGAPPLPDLVGQDFRPGPPGERYCGDITYVPTGEGWLYVASVLDLGSRRLCGWAMDETMPAGLVGRALEQAAELRGGDLTGALFHADRGSQGGFNRSSQHLDHGGVRWGVAGSRCRRRRQVPGDSGRRTGPCAHRCVRPGDRSPRGQCCGSSGG